MSTYEQLALIYVKKNAQPGDAPEKLLSMYNMAYEKITECERQHKGKTFSFE